jgi:hypothetical protein
MAVAGCFLAIECFRGTIRWNQLGMTPHRQLLIFAMGFLAMFSFYCILDRGGMKKFSTLCLALGGMATMTGGWIVATGSASPAYFNISVPSKAGYPRLLTGTAFLLLGLFSAFIHRRQNAGRLSGSAV